MAKLKIERGTAEGTSYFIEKEAVLGQDPSQTTIQISDSKVSRVHARIFRKGKNYFLEDLQSRNGTYLNGKPIEQKELLTPGDYIRVGLTWLSFGEDMEIEKVRRELTAYDILEEIDYAGSVGLCCKVHQVGLQRPVTLNLLPPSIIRSKAQLTQRFQQQARSLAQLSHENIAIMLDFEAKSSYLYLTTEYVQGEPLSTLLAREQKPDIDRGLEIAISVARALYHAHSQKVLHQGITPRCVILSGKRVILGGFGVAAVLSEVQEQFGGLVSKIEYLSPEQITRQKIDYRSDIYSLGALLYEVFAGRPPFVGGSLEEVAEAHRYDTPQAITAYNADVPAEIEHIIYQCLEKERNQRPQSCKEIADQLEQVLLRRKIIELKNAPSIYSSIVWHYVMQAIEHPFWIWIVPVISAFLAMCIYFFSGKATV